MKGNASIFLALLRDAGIPPPVAEYRFDAVRRWRFDYAWPALKLAVERDGGAFIGGRHTRGVGFIKDMEKGNAAVIQGWRVLHFTPQQLCTAETVRLIKAAGMMKGAA